MPYLHGAGGDERHRGVADVAEVRPEDAISAAVAGLHVPVTNALVWTIVALAFMVLASMAAGANMGMMPKMPVVVSRVRQRATRARLFTASGTTTLLRHSVLVPRRGSCSRRLPGRFGT